MMLALVRIEPQSPFSVLYILLDFASKSSSIGVAGGSL